MPVFLPVFLFVHNMLKGDLDVIKLSAVLAAPVVGHAFPIFYRMKGGKGIAVSFGCLLGMIPMWKPAAILAAYFIFFSCILRVSPHFYRMLAAYLCSLGTMLFRLERPVYLGFVLITAVVCIRMLMSNEKKEKLKVRLIECI